MNLQLESFKIPKYSKCNELNNSNIEIPSSEMKCEEISKILLGLDFNFKFCSDIETKKIEKLDCLENLKKILVFYKDVKSNLEQNFLKHELKFPIYIKVLCAISKVLKPALQIGALILTAITLISGVIIISIPPLWFILPLWLNILAFSLCIWGGSLGSNRLDEWLDKKIDDYLNIDGINLHRNINQIQESIGVLESHIRKINKMKPDRLDSEDFLEIQNCMIYWLEYCDKTLNANNQNSIDN